MRVPKGGVLLPEYPEAQYTRLDPVAFDLLVMDLAERGGDSSVSAILRLLHEQMHDRESMALTAKTAKATCWVVAILALVAVLVPDLRLRIAAAVSDVLLLLFFGSGIYLWLRRRSEFGQNAEEMVRIRNGSLTALV